VFTIQDCRKFKTFLVCGGRDYDDKGLVFRTLDSLVPLVVIQGGAQGADKLARLWAKKTATHCASVNVPALWDDYGTAAGPYRNEAMLRLNPDCVVAFPGGKGTANMITQARKAGIPVLRVK
jgi:hypothetical protein